MLISHKLPLTFDARLLQSDLRQLSAEDWTPHFNRNYYEGEWKGLSLYSTTGQTKQLSTLPNDTRIAIETPILARCPHLQQALSEFKCQFNFVRLLSLGPGAKIREHSDYFLGPEDGILRIHAPITTDSRVEFFVNHQTVVMQEGEAWYINFNLSHSVNNCSDKDRVHLIVDCKVNDWLIGMIPFDEEELAQVKPYLSAASA